MYRSILLSYNHLFVYTGECHYKGYTDSLHWVTTPNSSQVAHQPRKFETALQNSCRKTDGTGILIAVLVMVNL